MSSNKYAQFVEKQKRIAYLGSSIAVLQWDSEVNLPSQSAVQRSHQIAILQGILHEEITDVKYYKLLKELDKAELKNKDKKNLTLALRSVEKDRKFSKDFVIKKSMLISDAFNNWSLAKSKNDFSIYRDSLNELINISREETKILGYKKHPYDAMLDLYERDMTVEVLDEVFEIVKSELVPLAKQASKSNVSKYPFKSKLYPSDDQWNFSLHLLKSIGYDFNKGRQDKSLHPFTISFGPTDVRITTRIDEKDFSNIIWSSIHEGGHALYEQGLNEKNFGLYSGSAASLSIHESQSRIWENNIGRGKPFWAHHFPLLKKKFPSQLKGIGLDHFLDGINQVKSNKIRTEADELHYHLHVLIRYEIEKEIFSSNIDADGVRALWNELYKKYLGQTIKKDSEGILQDVHWSHGSFGYFPTYSLGSFYAAQFYHTIVNSIPGIENEIANGDNSKINAWLRNNIYKHGGVLTSEEICKKATGKGLDINFFKEYAIDKFLNNK